MTRTLFIWRYKSSTTEYIDVVACNEGVDPRARLLDRVPQGHQASIVIVLERVLAE